MEMMKAVAVIAVAGGGFWAYKNGHLDGFIQTAKDAFGVEPDQEFTIDLSGLDSLFGGINADGGTVEPAEPVIVDGAEAPEAVFDYGPTTAVVDPVVNEPYIAAPSGTDTGTRLLREHWADVQPWARNNSRWVACLMRQESAFNTNAVSSAGARGLMQVMSGTMADLHRWGWNKYPAEPQSLHLPNVGIYFGTAYLEYLYRNHSEDRETITRMYNAGPGGQRSNGTWPAETVNYLAQIRRFNSEYSQFGGDY